MFVGKKLLMPNTYYERKCQLVMILCSLDRVNSEFYWFLFCRNFMKFGSFRNVNYQVKKRMNLFWFWVICVNGIELNFIKKQMEKCKRNSNGNFNNVWIRIWTLFSEQCSNTTNATNVVKKKTFTTTKSVMV